MAALQAASSRIVVAVGANSHGETVGLCALALAERLGTEIVEFPRDVVDL